jgi:Kef-type K+ transport system membrane component KefB
VSALAAGLVERAPLSFPMLFLGLGFVVGDRGLGLISIGLDSRLLEVVAIVTLSLVLFLDAVNLELTELRRDWLAPLLVLGPATLLVAGLLAGAGMLLLGLPVVLAALLGTILASTDPVVLRDVLRDPRLPCSVRRILSVEAGTNDIVVLPILLVLIAIAHGDLGGPTQWLGFLGQLLVLGPAAGFAIGAAGSWVMGRVDQRFHVRPEYQSLYGIGLVLGAFVIGEAPGGDGFLAAFAAGLAVTAFNQTLCDCFLEFGQVIAEMTMLLAFVLFGAVLSSLVGEAPLLATVALAGLADEAGGRGDRDDQARALGAHDRQHGAGDVDGAEQGGLDLGPEVLGADLLEEPGVEVAGVVDQHVDAAEPFDGSRDGRLGVGGVGDVELDGQEVVVRAERGADPLGVASGGDDGVAGGQGGLGDVDAHAAAGAGDEPNLLVSHPSALLLVDLRAGHRVIGGALPTTPAAGGSWETLMREVLTGTPNHAEALVEWTTWQAATRTATSVATSAGRSGSS